MSSEFYTVCNDKNILLQKNDEDDYIINMTINPNENNSFTIIDIITELQLWNLLYKLNDDNIQEYKLTTINNYEQDIFIKINSNVDKNISDEIKNIIIHINTTYKLISNNECNIVCRNLNLSTVFFTDFIINILCLDTKIIIYIKFSIKDINDLIATYIALFIKKIFYRLSKYLE